MEVDKSILKSNLETNVAIFNYIFLFDNQLEDYEQFQKFLVDKNMKHELITFDQIKKKLVSSPKEDIYYAIVFDKFDGANYDSILSIINKNNLEHIIVGISCVYRCLLYSLPLPRYQNNRSIYSCCLSKVVIVFAGFKEEDRDKLNYYNTISHQMSAKINKVPSLVVTHVVSMTVDSEKYQLASGFGLEIVSPDWLDFCWEHAYDPEFDGSLKDISNRFFLKPFHGLKLFFIGFPDHEKVHMTNVALDNGAIVCEDPRQMRINYVVYYNNSSSSTDVVFPPITKHVKYEWFWSSVQMQTCLNDDSFMITDLMKKKKPLGNSPIASSNDENMNKSPTNCVKSNKVRSPLSNLVNSIRRKSAERSQKSSRRYMIASELLQTEKNYVCSLNSIINIYKNPLDQSLNDRIGSLISSTDLQIIFSSLPDIYHLHKEFLADLTLIVENWSENNLIGSLILKYTDKIKKLYPHFINFFDLSKETLLKCDSQSPRFHAFLKVCMSKPECNRESLTELLIRPVQRLPSIILILNELIKSTPTLNPDYKQLELAREALKSVTGSINEIKKKTDGQLQMFEVVKMIADCPANVLSSSRQIITRFDVIELADKNNDKGTPVTLFIFSDSLEIAKRKQSKIKVPSRMSMVTSSRPSPLATTSLVTHRHIMFMHLSRLFGIYDIKNIHGHVENVFGLVYNINIQNSIDEKSLVYFRASDHQIKNEIIEILAKYASDYNNVFKEDFIKIIDESEFLHQNPKSDSHSSNSSLVRVLSAARKTTRRMTRVLSFSNNKPICKTSTNGKNILDNSNIISNSTLSLFDNRSINGFNDEETMEVSNNQNCLDKCPTPNYRGNGNPYKKTNLITHTLSLDYSNCLNEKSMDESNESVILKNTHDRERNDNISIKSEN